MVIYEVNLSVDVEVADDYVVWLRQHVSEMLQIEGFNAAEIYQEEREDRQRGYSVRYRMSSREALDEYFDNHAPRMRGEGERQFGGRFSAARRILRPII